MAAKQALAIAHHSLSMHVGRSTLSFDLLLLALSTPGALRHALESLLLPHGKR